MSSSKRYVSDCREFPAANCSLSIAGSEAEVLDAAMQHAISKHGFKNTAEMREQIHASLKEEATVHA